MKYPNIIRDTIDFISDTEVCNIGYQEGVLSDERPYRLEVWSSHEITNATIFISIKDIENKSEEEIKKYLSDEGIIEIIEDDIYITEVEDVEDNVFLSINMPVLEKNKEINKYLVELKSFDI